MSKFHHPLQPSESLAFRCELGLRELEFMSRVEDLFPEGIAATTTIEQNILTTKEEMTDFVCFWHHLPEDEVLVIAKKSFPKIFGKSLFFFTKFQFVIYSLSKGKTSGEFHLSTIMTRRIYGSGLKKIPGNRLATMLTYNDEGGKAGLHPLTRFNSYNLFRNNLGLNIIDILEIFYSLQPISIILDGLIDYTILSGTKNSASFPVFFANQTIIVHWQVTAVINVRDGDSSRIAYKICVTHNTNGFSNDFKEITSFKFQTIFVWEPKQNEIFDHSFIAKGGSQPLANYIGYLFLVRPTINEDYTVALTPVKIFS